MEHHSQGSYDPIQNPSAQLDEAPDLVLLRSNSGTGGPAFCAGSTESVKLSYASAINRIGVTYGEGP